MKARIFYDAVDDGLNWNLDARDETGYSAECARFATWAEALEMIPEFMANLSGELVPW